MVVNRSRLGTLHLPVAATLDSGVLGPARHDAKPRLGDVSVWILEDLVFCHITKYTQLLNVIYIYSMYENVGTQKM